MRIIKEDTKYNPNSVNLIFSLVASFILSMAVVYVSARITGRLILDSKAQYESHFEDLAAGYAESVRLKLETYFFGLDTFIKSDIVENHSDEEIQKYVSSLKDLNHPDFMNVSFVNIKGIGYAQNRTTYDASGRDYYKAIMVEHKKKFVSEPILSFLNNEPIIIIASAVEDKNGETKGFFTASIKLSTFNANLDKMLIHNAKWLFILGKSGKFISHPDSNMLLRTYTPASDDFSHLPSTWVAKLEKGHYKTLSTDGECITIFVQKIKGTNWTLGISVTENVFETLHDKEVHYRIIIIIMGIAIMMILTGLEYYFINLLQRHQHIETIYDALTTLWTRKYFEVEASKILKRKPFSKYMFIECDIRGFRFIYQNYGEEASDNMIFFFSKLLNKITMRYGGIIGRGFADHFYILTKVSAVRKAMTVFKKELEKLNKKTKEYAIPFTAKFGISFLMPGKERCETIQELIGEASFAKTTIQDNLLSQFAIYNSKLLEKIKREKFIENHMEQALRDGEFFVMYQPKISLEDDKIVGAEALVRWNSPILGMMAPDSFIPLFERNGFIITLDFFVYEEVFKFLEAQIAKGEHVVPISVNMSRNHSKPDKFIHEFLEIFKRYTVPSNLIQVEILERSIIDNQVLKEITEKLHKEGFTVAMDDFGSGESSLNMLTKIPIDVLKFDREFLSSSTKDNGEIDKSSADFIEILIEMSKVLNKSTVFEGVETETQRDFLRSIKCDVAQGFFYSKPLTAPDFIEFIKMHK